MNRFKIVCDSSDSSSEESTTTKRGRQRPARTKKVNEAPSDKKQNRQKQSSQQKTEKKQSSKVFKKQQIQRQKINSEFIDVNEYKNTSSLNSQQKFIRQKVKSAQIQLQQIVQKIIITKKQRSKYYNACRLAARDLQKINKRIQKLKSNFLSQKNLRKSEINNSKDRQLQSMLQLQYKVSLHISKLLKQHQKTIQLILQCRKSIQRILNPIKYQFLTLQNMLIWNQSTQQMKQYGVEHIYKLLNRADNELQIVTQFNI